ncbi:hypothetical protein [Flavobacterium terrigena]|nr:hypothetical protein [Flavobacterium terrigena]
MSPKPMMVVPGSMPSMMRSLAKIFVSGLRFQVQSFVSLQNDFKQN